MFSVFGKTFARILAAAIFVVVVAAATVTVHANHRTVIVNGILLSAQDLYELDRLAGGFVPNGNYWYNNRTGYWGYVGDSRPRGRIGGGGGGLNYSGTLDRGPFGTYMSDGKCSFVNGIPVGNC